MDYHERHGEPRRHQDLRNTLWEAMEEGVNDYFLPTPPVLEEYAGGIYKISRGMDGDVEGGPGSASDEWDWFGILQTTFGF